MLELEKIERKVRKNMNENNVKQNPSSMGTLIQAILGAASILIPIILAILAWPAVTHNHPAYLIVLIVIIIMGIALLVRCKKPRRKGNAFIVLRSIGTVFLVLIMALMIYMKPYSSNVAGIEAAKSTTTINVTHDIYSWELTPTDKESTIGLVFYPGMLVEPRAYLPLLTPLVEQGVTVVVATTPMGITFDASGSATDAMEKYSNIDTWLVAGHSMGGASAASVANTVDGIDGLIIWASYGGMTVPGVKVISIYGTNDPFANQEIIDKNKQYLPEDTEYVAIGGGNHGYFADYDQPGDGEATIDRETAQKEIVDATLKFVASFRE